jgi:hypothetical protein
VRHVRLALLSSLVAVTLATLAGGSSAMTAGEPFYVAPPAKAPPPTRECQNLAYCYGVRGPWIVVPANGEATFLFGCPQQAKAVGDFLLGGSDARASSTHVEVWYDGRLGAPIGVQTPKSSTTGLLFHAVTDNGRPGSFQPVLGCINLTQASKLSTVSAVTTPPVGTLSAPPPKFNATLVELEPGWVRTITERCVGKDRLLGGWGAVGFGTAGPPVLPQAVKITTADVGNSVHAQVRTSTSVPYLIQIQVGVMCES